MSIITLHIINSEHCGSGHRTPDSNEQLNVELVHIFAGCSMAGLCSARSGPCSTADEVLADQTARNRAASLSVGGCDVSRVIPY